MNTDPRTIAVPNGWVNIIPTDVRGLTFSRTPQQVLNILFLGNPEAKGVFFPNGVYGAINKPVGYNVTASGLDSFPASGAQVATQVSDSSSPAASLLPGTLDCSTQKFANPRGAAYWN